MANFGNFMEGLFILSFSKWGLQQTENGERVPIIIQTFYISFQKCQIKTFPDRWCSQFTLHLPWTKYITRAVRGEEKYVI